MSSKSTGTRKNRSPSKTPSPSKEKSPSKKGRTNLFKSIRKGRKDKDSHDFKSQRDLKDYLKNKYGEKRKKNWWKYIIKIHPKRVSSKIVDDTPDLFDGKNLKALIRLVAIKKNAKEKAEKNEEKANNFIEEQKDLFLNGDPEVDRLMKKMEAKIIDETAESMRKTDENNRKIHELNRRGEKLGVLKKFPTNKHDFKGVTSDITSQVLVNSLPNAPTHRPFTSSKRGGKKTRGKRSNRRVTKRVKS